MNIRRYFSEIILKILLINDSNQKIALGISVGVFFGIFPGAGPIIAVLTAILLRLNKAAVVIGCLLTNTWVTAILLIPASKIGSKVLGLEWIRVLDNFKLVVKDFKITKILDLTIAKILVPILFGYMIIALCLGIFAYLVSLIIVISYRKSSLKSSNSKELK